MPGFGREVADAYVDVHGDTRKVKRDLKNLAKRDLKDLKAAFDGVFRDDVTEDQVDQWKSFRKELASTAQDGNWDRMVSNYDDLGQMQEDVNRRMEIMRQQTIKTTDENGKAHRRVMLTQKEQVALAASLNDYVERESRLRSAMSGTIAEQLDKVRLLNDETGEHGNLLAKIVKAYQKVDEKNFSKTFDAAKIKSANDEFRKFDSRLADVARSGDWTVLRKQYESVGEFVDDVTNRMRLLYETEVNDDGIRRRVLSYQDLLDLSLSLNNAADEMLLTEKQTSAIEHALQLPVRERLDKLRQMNLEGTEHNDLLVDTENLLRKVNRQVESSTFGGDKARAAADEMTRFRRQLADVANNGDWSKIFKNYDSIGEAVDDIKVKLERLHEEEVNIDGVSQRVLSYEDMNDLMGSMRVHADKMYAIEKNINTEVGDTHDKLRKTENIWKRLVKGDGTAPTLFLGRLKGSRNDFLNIVGGLFTGIETLVGNVMNVALKPLDNIMDNIIEKIQGDGTSGFRMGLGSVLRSTGGAARAGAAGLVVFAAAVIAVETLASALVTAASAAAAGIVVLAGILADTLGAAAALALPIVGGLAAAIATIAIGIDGMTDKQKDLLQPFGDWYEEVKKMVAEELWKDLGEQVDGFMTAVGDFGSETLMSAAENIREAISEIVDDLSTTDFQNTLAVLSEHLGEIAGSIVSITADGIRGVLGIMAAIAPYAEEIAEDIADAVENWANWANSAEGQTSIATWFENVWETATKVWEVLVLIGDIVGELFSAAQPTGQGWLDGWIEGLQGFLDFLRSPEGQQQMEDWFQRAEDIFAKVGELVDAIGRLWDTLDDDEGAGAFGGLIDALVFVLDLVTGIATAIGTFKESWGEIANWDWSSWDETWSTIWNGYLDYLNEDEAIQALKEWWTGAWSGFVEWLTGSQQKIKDLAKGIIDGIVQGLGDYWQSVMDKWDLLWNSFVDWVKDFLGINSPSTVMIEIAKDIIAGLVLGLVPDEVIEAVQRLLNAMLAEFRDFVDDPAGYISDALDNILTVLEEGALGPIPAAAASVARSIWDAFSPVPAKVMTPVNAAMSGVNKAISTGLATSRTNASTGISRIGDQFDRFEFMEGKVRNGVDLIPLIIKNRLISAKTAATNGVTNLLEAMGNVGAKIKAKFTSISLYSAGANLMGGLARGIADYAYLPINAAGGVAGKVSGVVKKALLIQSPSKVFEEIGAYLMEGMALGISKEERLVVSAAQAMAEAIQEPFDSINTSVDTSALTNLLDRTASGLSVSVGGGVPNGSAAAVGKQIIVEEGAIQVTSNSADGEQVAMATLDRFAARSGV